MSDNKKKALELIAEADRKLGSSSSFLSKISVSIGMTRPSDVKEEAIELLNKAGNMLKMAKEWSDAGNVFRRAGDLHEELNNGKTHSAEEYFNAAKCYMKVSPNEAVDCLMKTIAIYTDMGRFSVAAKYHTTIAEIYEEQKDIPKAVEHYSKAADYYQCEESNANASRCLLNVARYAALLKQYQRAIEIYEDVGKTSVDSKLLKYGAKEHFLRACLCHLCVDHLNAQIAQNKYISICPSFLDSRECKLVKDILNAIEEQDGEAYEAVIQDYNSISSFDEWFREILTRIKTLHFAGEDLR